jgi:hypothetical protein
MALVATPPQGALTPVTQTFRSNLVVPDVD